MTRPATGGRGWPPYFVPLAAITFLLWLGSSILVPVLPLLGTSLGLSHAEVGVVIGAFFGGRMVCNMAGGYLADRFSPRAVAVLGCLVTSAASAVAGLADSFGALVAARVVQGGGAGIYLTVAVAAVIAVSPATRVGSHVAAYQGIGLVGFAVGPVIGGVVAQVGGLRAPFFAYAVVTLAGMAVAAVALPGHPLRPTAAESARTAGFGDYLRAAMSRPFVLSLLVAVLIFGVRSGILNTLVPVLAETGLSMTEVAIGTVLTVAAFGNVAVLRHAGRSLDRGRRPVLVGGTVATGIATALLGLAMRPWMLFAGCVVLAVATAYASVAPTVVTADVMTGAVQGRAVGTLRVATDLGLLVGPVMAGALADVVGLRPAFILAGICVLALAGLTGMVPETRPQQVSAEVGHS